MPLDLSCDDARSSPSSAARRRPRLFLAARRWHAQQPRKLWRIGLISGLSRPASIEASALGGILVGMREHGYVEGRDFVIEWRFAEGRYDRIAGFAVELMRLNVDIFVITASAAIRTLQQATSTIPIVMTYSTDPVGNGFVASLSRPGGNITGLGKLRRRYGAETAGALEGGRYGRFARALPSWCIRRLKCLGLEECAGCSCGDRPCGRAFAGVEPAGNRGCICRGDARARTGRHARPQLGL